MNSKTEIYSNLFKINSKNNLGGKGRRPTLAMAVLLGWEMSAGSGGSSSEWCMPTVMAGGRRVGGWHRAGGWAGDGGGGRRQWQRVGWLSVMRVKSWPGQPCAYSYLANLRWHGSGRHKFSYLRRLEAGRRTLI
jgi:hypothetical protein